MKEERRETLLLLLRSLDRGAKEEKPDKEKEEEGDLTRVEVDLHKAEEVDLNPEGRDAALAGMIRGREQEGDGEKEGEEAGQEKREEEEEVEEEEREEMKKEEWEEERHAAHLLPHSSPLCLIIFIIA